MFESLRLRTVLSAELAVGNRVAKMDRGGVAWPGW
jgi:hypothetical protein